MSSTTNDILTNVVTQILVGIEELNNLQTVGGVTNTEVQAVATIIKGVRVGGNSTNGNTAGKWAYQNVLSNTVTNLA